MKKFLHSWKELINFELQTTAVQLRPFVRHVSRRTRKKTKEEKGRAYRRLTHASRFDSRV